MFDKLDVYNYNCFQIQHQDSDLQMLLTSEIIHVNIVVGKVGPIRKLFQEILRSLIYLLWHGEIVMAGPGCGLNI